MKLSLLILIGFFHLDSYAQDSTYKNEVTSDSLYIYQSLCKPFTIFIYNPEVKNPLTSYPASIVALKPIKPKFITIHGNVSYDFQYQSFVDTPYSQNDFQQHTVRTSLDILVFEKYPIKLNLSNRHGNSPFFRNTFDANLSFDRYRYITHIKEKLLDQLNENLQAPNISIIENLLSQELSKRNQIKSWLISPDLRQKIVEEKEKEWYRAKNNVTSPPLNVTPEIFNAQPISTKIFSPFVSKRDSIDSKVERISDLIMKKQSEFDSLNRRISVMQGKLDSIKKKSNENVRKVREQIYKAKNIKSLSEIAENNDLKLEDKKNLRFLSNLKSLGLGRSVINYSELTAWNVALTGMSIEYQSKTYTAFAAGKIDYGFRDLLSRKEHIKNQNITIGRIGLGDPDKKALIFSFFQGTKSNYGIIQTDSTSLYSRIAGYSIEGILKQNSNSAISLELAKTTIQNIKPRNKSVNGLTDFSGNENMGLVIKGELFLNLSGGKFSGYYRQTGENFQSFGLYTYNSDQKAWSVKYIQPLFKKRMDIIVMLRQNDFINPFTEKTYKASTVFKTFQLQTKFQKFPAIMLGYYPGTQLYFIDKERIQETLYYILAGSAVHNYTIIGTRMISCVSANKYSSKAVSNGFTSYNGINLSASHRFIFQKSQFNLGYNFIKHEHIAYRTTEMGAEHSFTKHFRFGITGKINKVTKGKAFEGGSVVIGLDSKKLGGFQLQYEKSFLPTINKELLPVKIGHISWIKYF